MAKLDYPSLFCHELVIAPDGTVADYKLRMADQKRRAVEAFKSLNFKVVSTGDSYNDLSMLRAADRAVLYRRPKSSRRKIPTCPSPAITTRSKRRSQNSWTNKHG